MQIPFLPDFGKQAMFLGNGRYVSGVQAAFRVQVAGQRKQKVPVIIQQGTGIRHQARNHFFHLFIGIKFVHRPGVLQRIVGLVLRIEPIATDVVHR